MIFIPLQDKATLLKLRTLHAAYSSWVAALGYHTRSCTALKSSIAKSLFSVITVLMPTGTLHIPKEIKPFILKVD